LQYNSTFRRQDNGEPGSIVIAAHASRY